MLNTHSELNIFLFLFFSRAYRVYLSQQRYYSSPQMYFSTRTFLIITTSKFQPLLIPISILSSYHPVNRKKKSNKGSKKATNGIYHRVSVWVNMWLTKMAFYPFQIRNTYCSLDTETRQVLEDNHMHDITQLTETVSRCLYSEAQVSQDKQMVKNNKPKPSHVIHASFSNISCALSLNNTKNFYRHWPHGLKHFT